MTTSKISLRSHDLAREALGAASVAAGLAAFLAWYGPPGSDVAAHVYQSALYHEHGFLLWNNFWYEGRYSFVTYSLLYYPVAALFGIRLLAVASVAAAAVAFSVIAAREWGPAARWANRSFAVVWAGIVLSGAFPFALGAALALLALWALQSRLHGRFALLTALCFAASPLSFVLLVVLLAAIGLARAPKHDGLLLPVVTVALLGAVEAVLWRLFPMSGRFPFSIEELAAACVFCLFGMSLTWGIAAARILRWMYAVYLLVCLGAFLVPSGLGENIARLRFAALPLAILTLSLRRWRPLPLAVLAFVLALAWNLTPLAASYAKGASDTAAHADYWAPSISFLHNHLNPSYRVEAVDTVGHWPAEYLPAAGIPIARGWFRQEDFPRNKVLYDHKLGAPSYVRWLREMGVQYVVLSDAPLDYSSRAEAQLLVAARTSLRPVFRSVHTTVYAVPSPHKLVTGPARADVVKLDQSRLTFAVGAAGRYRIAMSWSPYWRVSSGCIERGDDGMTVLDTSRAGMVTMRFTLAASSALATLAGRSVRSCAS